MYIFFQSARTEKQGVSYDNDSDDSDEKNSDNKEVGLTYKSARSGVRSNKINSLQIFFPEMMIITKTSEHKLIITHNDHIL